MRKLILAAASAAALAISSGANAVPVITGATGVNDPNPFTTATAVTTNGTTTTIIYGQNPLTVPSFTGGFTFNNSEAGLYSIVLNTSTPGTAFTAAALTGLVNGVTTTYNLFALDSQNFKLNPSFLSAGQNYTFTFSGTNADPAASLSGNVTVRAVPAVPEPGTWAMMLLGFGATGLMMRRRNRRTVLAQVA